MGFPAERIGLLADRAEESVSVGAEQSAQLFQRNVSVRPKAVETVEQPQSSVQSRLSAFRRRRS